MVFFIKVHDPDGDGITCEIIDKNSPFKMRRFNIVLKSGQNLDFSKKKEYDVTIKCSDNGSPSLSLTENAKIQVKC